MKNLEKQVNILGTTWKIDTSDNDPVLEGADGYCDHTLKRCVIKNITPTTNSVGDLEEYTKRVTRHEIIHAFLFESGLGTDSWAGNEEIVDWIARQFPKLVETFSELDIL